MSSVQQTDTFLEHADAIANLHQMSDAELREAIVMCRRAIIAPRASEEEIVEARYVVAVCERALVERRYGSS